MTSVKHLWRVGLDVTPKPNVVRALDVAAIGPVMIAAGFWPTLLPALIRFALVVFGTATITYNWRNIR